MSRPSRISRSASSGVTASSSSSSSAAAAAVRDGLIEKLPLLIAGRTEPGEAIAAFSARSSTSCFFRSFASRSSWSRSRRAVSRSAVTRASCALTAASSACEPPTAAARHAHKPEAPAASVGASLSGGITGCMDAPVPAAPPAPADAPPFTLPPPLPFPLAPWLWLDRRNSTAGTR